MTQALGVNDSDEVVGTDPTGSGDSAVSHGVVWRGGKFSTVDVGGGATATTVGCAACGTSARLHARRMVWVRDLPIGGRPVAAHGERPLQ